MARKTAYFVVCYRMMRGGLRPDQPRTASSEEHAVQLACVLADRFASVVAAEMIADEETGDYFDPRILAVHGAMPAEIAEVA